MPSYISVLSSQFLIFKALLCLLFKKANVHLLICLTYLSLLIKQKYTQQ